MSYTRADRKKQGITTKAVKSITYISQILDSPDTFLGRMNCIILFRSDMVLTTTPQIFPIGYRFTTIPNTDQLAKLILYKS